MHISKNKDKTHITPPATQHMMLKEPSYQLPVLHGLSLPLKEGFWGSRGRHSIGYILDGVLIYLCVAWVGRWMPGLG